jgi:hypothetical protein
MNKEYKTPDTYGSKLRNRLSPFYNMISAVYSITRSNDTSISKEVLVNFLVDSVDNLWEDYKKILEMSYDPLLNKTEYKE